MSFHAFVDESQGPPFRMAIALVPSKDVARVRSAVRMWRHRGAKRFHASKERDSVRAAALRSLDALPVVPVIVEVVAQLPPSERRAIAVAAVTRVALDASAVRLVLEDAEPERARDLASIARILARSPGVTMNYCHLRASAEPLLWVADLIAWAYARGGRWRERLPQHMRMDIV